MILFTEKLPLLGDALHPNGSAHEVQLRLSIAAVILPSPLFSTALTISLIFLSGRRARAGDRGRKQTSDIATGAGVLARNAPEKEYRPPDHTWQENRP